MPLYRSAASFATDPAFAGRYAPAGASIRQIPGGPDDLSGVYAPNAVKLSNSIAPGATGTFEFTGLPQVGTYSLGYLYNVKFVAWDSITGGHFGADMSMNIGRNGDAAFTGVPPAPTNWMNTEFGGPSSGGLRVDTSCAADGTTLTITVQNTAANTRGCDVLLIPHLSPNPDPSCFAAYGDSLTASGSPSWPATAQGVVGGGRDILNVGIPGDTSRQIAARVNAVPTVLLDGVTIPAVGSVAVDTSTGSPTVADAASRSCTIAGIPGFLSFSAGHQLFTRARTGASVQVPAGAPVTYTGGVAQALMRIPVIWAGRNDDVTGWADVPANVAAVIAASSSSKHLVMSVLNSALEPTGSANHAAIAACNATLSATYGARYLDIRAYLISEQALTDAGLTATVDDLADIAAGVVPRQIRSDNVHLSQAGYDLVGQQVGAKLLDLGF